MSFPGGKLSVGSIADVVLRAYTQPVVVQVIEVKKVSPAPGSNASERFRLMISDSVNFAPAMLATQQNDLVNNGSVQLKGVVRLTDYICNPVPGKNGGTNRIVVILGLEPVSNPLANILGNPTDVLSQNAQSAPAPAALSAPAPNFGSAPVSAPNYGATNNTMSNSTYSIDPTTGQQIVPIKLLDPYLPRWAIRARCSQKSDIKHWQNERGSGQLFSATFLDESGEIRATLFNDAVDKFFPILVQDGVYIISQGKLTFAKKQYTSVKHAYELTLNADSQVLRIEGEESLPHLHFDFVDIDNIQDSKKDDMVDIIGVVVKAKPIAIVSTKRGDTARRTITMADTSNRTIDLTIWGDHATGFDEVLSSYGNYPIMAVKGARVSDYGGRSLSAVGPTEFELNPQVPANDKLRVWLQNIGEGIHNLPSLTQGSGGTGGGAGSGAREKTLSAIKNESLGFKNEVEYITVPNVVITNFKKEGTLWYKACTNPDCKGKRVFDEGGNFKCATCGSVNNYKLRWVTNATAFDATALEYVSGFGDAGTTLLGKEADEVAMLQESNDPAFHLVFEDAKFRSYNMKLSVKNEVYQENQRVKVGIQSLTPIDYVTDSRRLLARIEELGKA